MARKSLAYDRPAVRGRERSAGRYIPPGVAYVTPSGRRQIIVPTPQAVGNASLANPTTAFGHGRLRDPRQWWQGSGLQGLINQQMPGSLFGQLFGGGNVAPPPPAFRPIASYTQPRTFNINSGRGSLYDTNYSRYGRR